jgi:hypothetical protein
MRVRRGEGIQVLDTEIELASYKTLLGIYHDRVSIIDPDDIPSVLFSFQKYLYREFENIYFHLKLISRKEQCEGAQRRLFAYKEAIDLGITVAPSQLLADILYLKTLIPIVNVREVSCCIKLKGVPYNFSST